MSLPRRRPAGFSLVELLVVIAIILILIGLLIPAVGRVRRSAQIASTRAFLEQLARAIEAYNTDFNAYPGPLSNAEVASANTTPPAFPLSPPFNSALGDPVPASPGFALPSSQSGIEGKITMAENMVLGLLGGLVLDRTTSQLRYDPKLVGSGATSLNLTGPVKRYRAYVESQNLYWGTTSTGLKTGHFVDGAGPADDTIIPEFVDTFPSPMPILYMRAKKGAAASTALAVSNTNNTIVTFDTALPGNRVGQYDLHQIIGYTGSKIGVDRDVIQPVLWSTPPTHGLSATASDKIEISSSLSPQPPSSAKYRYPFDAYAYLRNAALSSPSESEMAYGGTSPRNDVPHQKDSFILIAPGPDRIYGTRDDITNFGDVGR